MPLVNIFKKKKPEVKKEVGKKPAEKIGEVKKEIKKGSQKKKPGLGQTLAYRVLKTPHITEKATDLAKKNQYVFKIYSDTNKVEIKKVIEDLYQVKVLTVKIINVPKRQRRVGRTLGWRKGYKKAIVKIKEGQKMEVMPR